MKKILFLSLGTFATVLAFIGLFLPGLPTVPLLIVALWAFGNSSEPLRARLAVLPVFKSAMKHVEEFEQHKTVRKEVKIVSIASAWISFAGLWMMRGLADIATLSVLVVAIICTVAMHKIATKTL